MKYTKDNIIGVEFNSGNYNYTITEIRDGNQVYGYNSGDKGKVFHFNSLSGTIDYLNNGTWKLLTPPKPLEVSFSIF